MTKPTTYNRHDIVEIIRTIPAHKAKPLTAEELEDAALVFISTCSKTIREKIVVALTGSVQDEGVLRVEFLKHTVLRQEQAALNTFTSRLAYNLSGEFWIDTNNVYKGLTADTFGGKTYTHKQILQILRNEPEYAPKPLNISGTMEVLDLNLAEQEQQAFDDFIDGLTYDYDNQLWIDKDGKRD